MRGRDSTATFLCVDLAPLPSPAVGQARGHLGVVGLDVVRHVAVGEMRRFEHKRERGGQRPSPRIRDFAGVFPSP
jgi:hypothetical protein